MSIDQLKKYFCNICGYCFVKRWVEPNNILRSIFWFLLLIFGVFKVNFEPTLFFRTSSYSHFAVLNISLLDEFFDSLSWMEFGICFMALVSGLINYECKEAYRLSFCKVNKFHFTD